MSDIKKFFVCPIKNCSVCSFGGFELTNVSLKDQRIRSCSSTKLHEKAVQLLHVLRPKENQFLILVLYYIIKDVKEKRKKDCTKCLSK